MPEQDVIEEVATEVVEPAEAAQVEEEGEDKPKAEHKPNPVQKRIDELTRQKRESEREAAFWREAAQAKPKEAEPEKPKRADFADDEAYLDARDAYVEAKAVSKAKAELAAENVKHSQEKAAQTVAQTYGERVSAFKAQTEDFDEVMQAAEDIRVSAAARDAILESEMGPQVAYHLAKHPEVAAKLAGMSPLTQVRELGKLETQLSKQPDPEITSAPTPARAVPTGTSVKNDPNRMSQAEYEAWRMKQKPRWAR